MEGKFPDILKVSRILPILKQGKDKFAKESYTPISNLHCIENIFEQHIKMHLDLYCDIVFDHFKMFLLKINYESPMST